MCGLSGFIDFNYNSTKSILKQMSDVLHHRGPDDSGYEIIDDRVAQIGFGFKRLSIIDLSSSAHQPMKSGDGNYSLIFNG